MSEESDPLRVVSRTPVTEMFELLLLELLLLLLVSPLFLFPFFFDPLLALSMPTDTRSTAFIIPRSVDGTKAADLAPGVVCTVSI